MKIAVLALNGVFDTGLAAVLDTLATANELAALESFSVPRFESVVVGIRETVSTSLGFSVPIQPVDAMRRPDWVIVPALGTKMPKPLLQVLEGQEAQEAVCTENRKLKLGRSGDAVRPGWQAT
jgi:hypothetical protein